MSSRGPFRPKTFYDSMKRCVLPNMQGGDVTADPVGTLLSLTLLLSPIVVYCGPAPHFPFAESERAVGDRSLAGTALRYRCNPGYTAARGKSSVVTCLSDTTWSADPEFCIREYLCSSPVPTDCMSDLYTLELLLTLKSGSCPYLGLK